MTFEPAPLAAGTRPNLGKPWEMSPRLHRSRGLFLPHTQHRGHGPFPCLAHRPCPTRAIPAPSPAQPHEGTLDRAPTKQALGLGWGRDLYFINADSTAAPDAAHACCSQPRKPGSLARSHQEGGSSRPGPTAGHLLGQGGVSPPWEEAGSRAGHPKTQRGGLCRCSAAVRAQAQH